MQIIILIVVVLAAGIWIGFLIGFSRAMREAAKRGQQKGQATVLRWLLTIMGCASLAASFFVSIYTWHFTRIAQRTDGVVVQLRQTKDDDGGLLYAPTFQFQDLQGASHTIDSTFFTSPPNFRVGEKVEVLYRADKPDSAHIDSLSELWGLPMVLALIGSIAVIIGLILFSAPKLKDRFRGTASKEPAETPLPG